MKTLTIEAQKKTKKTARKGRTMKAKVVKKTTPRPLGFFESLNAQFHQVAPLDWVPATYQTQIKMAKPLRALRPRKKDEKTIH